MTTRKSCWIPKIAYFCLYIFYYFISRKFLFLNFSSPIDLQTFLLLLLLLHTNARVVIFSILAGFAEMALRHCRTQSVHRSSSPPLPAPPSTPQALSPTRYRILPLRHAGVGRLPSTLARVRSRGVGAGAR